MKRREMLSYLFVAVCLCMICILFGFLFSSRDLSAAQQENCRLFGATYMTMNNPYYQVIDEQLRAEIEANGDILLSRDAVMDQDRQNEEILDLIDAGAQVIFLTPVTASGVEEGLKAAQEAGIPVIVIDAPVENEELATCSILSANYQAGVLCAQHLLATRDHADILLLEHVTAVSGAERIQGFIDTIEGHEGFRILSSGQSDGQIENAMPVMERLLEEYPEADTLMTLNDPSAFGGMAAIQGAGLTDRFLVYSVDGTPEGKAMVKEGLMTATCAQFPLKITKEAVRQGYLALEGKCEQKKITIPVALLTAENIDNFGTDGWQ